MYYLKKHRSRFGLLILPLLLAITLPAGVVLAGSAAAQSDCDNGTVGLTWSSLGLARPVIASMLVDGESIADPMNPADGSVGAAICAGTDKGARTGLSVYYHHMDGNNVINDYDLTNALTPAGHPITASSQITITLTNMGDLAKYFSFALVHGAVSTWTTANLGSPSASLTVTLSPVRTPAGTGTDFGYCTATPPSCSAAKSDNDYLGAGLDMSFDQSGNSTFNGAYFGLVSAMGGFVQAVNNTDGTKSLVATLGAPHLLADGATPNVGSLSAFLPNTVLESLFNLPAGGVDTSTLAVTRTDGASTADAPFTVTPITGGVIVKLSNITFSSPVYTIKKVTQTASTASPTAVSSAASPSVTPSATVASAASPSVTPSAKTRSATLAPDKNKSTIRVDGSNIVADGVASYRVVVTVKDKNGTIIKTKQPVFSADEVAQVILSTPILIGDEWMANVSSKTAGDKIITIKVGTVQLNDAKMSFVLATSPSPSPIPLITPTPSAIAAPIVGASQANKRPLVMVVLAGLIVIGLASWLFLRSPNGTAWLARLRH